MIEWPRKHLSDELVAALDWRVAYRASAVISELCSLSGLEFVFEPLIACSSGPSMIRWNARIVYPDRYPDKTGSEQWALFGDVFPVDGSREDRLSLLLTRIAKTLHHLMQFNEYTEPVEVHNAYILSKMKGAIVAWGFGWVEGDNEADSVQ